MKREHEPKLRPRMQQAIADLKGRIQEQYPDATFRVTRNPEEPRHIHLVTTVDVEDTDVVLDAVIDQVLALQLQQKLPVHVIPVRPRERVAALLAETAATGPGHATKTSTPSLG